MLITIKYHSLSFPNYEVYGFSHDSFFVVVPFRSPTPLQKERSWPKSVKVNNLLLSHTKRKSEREAVDKYR